MRNPEFRDAAGDGAQPAQDSGQSTVSSFHAQKIPSKREPAKMIRKPIPPSKRVFVDSLADYFYYVLLVFKRNAKVSMKLHFPAILHTGHRLVHSAPVFPWPIPVPLDSFFLSGLHSRKQKRISWRKPRYIENHHRQKARTLPRKRSSFFP